MSLRLKTTIVIALILIGLIVSIQGITHLVILGNFGMLEEQIIREHVHRAEDALADQLADLNSKTGDWANFDDAYAFVEDHNSEYIRTNPTDTSFIQLRVNVMLFIDASGQMIYSKAFDLQSQHGVPVPPALQDPNATTFFLRYLGPETSLTGVMLLPEGPLLVAARPILTSNGAGPAHGILVFGRYLDDSNIGKLAQTTQLSITVRRLDEAQLPDDDRAARAVLATPQDTFVKPLSETSIAGYALLNDIFGKPALLLRVDHPRDIYAQGKTSVQYFTLLVSLVALLFGMIAWVLVERLARSRQKNRESEERYCTLAETAPDAIFILNPTGSVEYANTAAARQTDRRPEEMVGKRLNELFPPAVAEGYLRSVRKVVETNQPFQNLSATPFRGNPIYLDTKLVPIRDAAGMPIAVMGVSRDVTESKRAEDFRLKFELALERSGEAIFMTEPDGTIVYVNPTFVKTYGYSKEETLGKTPRILKSGVLSAENYVHFWNALLAKRVVAGETVNKTKDGRLLNIDGSANPILNETGDIIGFLAIQRDITQRKHAEEALRDSEEQYRLLFENNPHPMWAYDLETLAFLAVNDAAVHHYGYSREEFLAMTIKDIRPREDIPALLGKVAETTDSIRKSGIWQHRKKDGTLIFVEITTHSTIFAGRRARLVLANDVTERKRTEEQNHLQLRRLGALREIDQAITSSVDLRLTLNILLAQVTAQLNVDAADILLLKPPLHMLEYAAGRGFRSSAIARTRLALGEEIAGRAALERRVVQNPNLSEAGSARANSPLVTQEGFVSQYALPLIAKGQVKGVLELFNRTPLHPESEWLDFAEALARQAAIALDDAEMFTDLQRSNIDLMLAYDTTLEGWSRALDLRDQETEGHTQRVTETTVQLARAIGLSENDLVHIRRGALLHDIGKMGIPDSILLKPGALTDKEWEVMRKHPAYAFDLLSPIAYLHAALDIPHYHHEKWDGTGYPRGLAGEQIPLAARIFMVVDVWDALRSDRPYRAAWSEERAIAHIRSAAGTHFDPRMVEQFLRLPLPPRPAGAARLKRTEP